MAPKVEEGAIAQVREFTQVSRDDAKLAIRVSRLSIPLLTAEHGL
jgi:hypothetical protein